MGAAGVTLLVALVRKLVPSLLFAEIIVRIRTITFHGNADSTRVLPFDQPECCHFGENMLLFSQVEQVIE